VRFPTGWKLTGFAVEFLRPMLIGVHYWVEAPSFEAVESGGKWTAALFDGSVPMVSLVVEAGPVAHGDTYGAQPVSTPAACPRRDEAAMRPLDSIVPGVEVSGQYACQPERLRELSERWGVDPAMASLFCFSSYVVGTELPGESNLCAKAACKLVQPIAAPIAASYTAKVGVLDKRFNKVRIDVNLASGSSPVATGQYWSFIRPEPPPTEAPVTEGVRADALAGRSAALIEAAAGWVPPCVPP
jgi:hypothetical protein